MIYPFLKSNAQVSDVWAWAKRLVDAMNRRDRELDNNSAPAGTVMFWLTEAAPGGWLVCDGSAHITTDYPKLFATIGYTYGGGGPVFRVPDLRDRLLMGAGATVALGASAGTAQVGLSADNLPTHTHGITDPGHDHPFVGYAHVHGVTDPGHNHAITDPSHSHVYSAPAGSDGAGAGSAGSSDSANTSSEVTGITVNGNTTGLTVNPAVATGRVDPARTNISVQPTGGGLPFSVLNPVLGVHAIIKG